ncbi:hypothetical protein J2T13_003608 [Paenibacillus sp. DS2015]
MQVHSTNKLIKNLPLLSIIVFMTEQTFLSDNRKKVMNTKFHIHRNMKMLELKRKIP